MTTPFFGFASDVWTVAFLSIQYLSDKLASATKIGDTETVAKAVLATLLNGCAKINAFNYATAWTQELANITAIQASAISLNSLTLTTLNNRANAYAGAATAAKALASPVNTATIATLLSHGDPAIPDPGFLDFYKNFNFETPPTIPVYGSFIAQASTIPLAFQNVADSVRLLQGNFLSQAYDCANRLQLSAQIAFSLLISYKSGQIGGTNATATWNQLVTLPAMVQDAALLSSAPYSLSAQQNCVIRNAMMTLAQQIATFLLVLRRPQTSNINLATVLRGDSLMDIAARNLGDFEKWKDIATLNNLVPPYIGEITKPGIAGYGSQLILPNSTTSLSAVGQQISYANNFLGIDFFLGPINQPMLPWTGDFQIIAGYQNLAISLGRRLQTTLGTLIYHSKFGSLIPPEVGSIATSDEALRIEAFGRSALLSDPRVAKVQSSKATQGANYAVNYQGTVIPAGLSSQTISVNEVIGPAL